MANSFEFILPEHRQELVLAQSPMNTSGENSIDVEEDSSGYVRGQGRSEDSSGYVLGHGKSEDSSGYVLGHGKSEDSSGYVLGHGRSEDSSGYVLGHGRSEDSSGYVLGQGRSEDSSGYVLGNVTSVQSSRNERASSENLSNSSSIVSQILQEDVDVKVRQWLNQLQTEIEIRGLILNGAIDISSLQLNTALPLFTSFAASESGSIAIPVVSPRLRRVISVIHPNSGKSVSVLHTNKRYYSPVFLKKPGEDKEYLAVHCVDDMSIHLWDIERKTSRVVFQANANHRGKDLSLIDSTTVAYAEFRTSGSAHNINILNTESEPWQLRNIMKVEGLKFISDMCHAQVAGTSCLVFCCPSDGIVQAVEMVGDNIRWIIGIEEMGHKFYPVGASADTKGDSLLISAPGQNSLHQVDADTRTMIRSIELVSYGFCGPYCVRITNESIYVGCKQINSMRRVVANFKKNKL